MPFELSAAALSGVCGRVSSGGCGSGPPRPGFKAGVFYIMAQVLIRSRFPMIKHRVAREHTVLSKRVRLQERINNIALEVNNWTQNSIRYLQVMYAKHVISHIMF